VFTAQQANRQLDRQSVFRVLDNQEINGMGVCFCMAFTGFSAERQRLDGADGAGPTWAGAARWPP
jgi:hypothetical protein